METRRVLILVASCVLVFVLWSFLYNKLYPAPKPGAPPPPGPAAQKPPVEPEKPPPPVKPDPGPAKQPAVAEQTTVLKNKNLTVTLTNKGAGIREAVLDLGGQPVQLLEPFDPEVPSLALEIVDGADDLARTAWTVKESEAGRSVTYGYVLRSGIEIEKKLTLEPDQHSVKQVLNVLAREPKDAPTEKLRFKLHALTGLRHDSDYYYERYGTGAVGLKPSGGGHKLQSIAVDQPGKDGKPVQVLIPEGPDPTWHDWFGLRNRYFVALLIPETELDRKWLPRLEYRGTTQKGTKGQDMKALAVDAYSVEVTAGATRFTAQHRLFLAPLKEEALAEVPGIAGLFLSYGCWGLFNWIGGTILWVLNLVHGIVGNYGWAILLTTIIVKLCMFPLSKKGQVSMARMSELQPKMKVLQERYADDPQRMQAETWKLYRENGVNPLSGCLPLMIQFPIFAGLYSVFDSSVDLRNSPFMLWIHDLSQPDRLVVFQHPISLLLFSVHELNVLPLLMTAAWIVQAMTAPKSPDPNMASQQKMMMFMPLLFGFMTYTLASGLSLYMFMNFLLGIVEQKVIKKFFLPAAQPKPA